MKALGITYKEHYLHYPRSLIFRDECFGSQFSNPLGRTTSSQIAQAYSTWEAYSADHKFLLATAGSYKPLGF